MIILISAQLNELAAALSKAQGEMKGALKDSKNPFFKSNYADLSSIWEACRGPLAKHGLSVVQTTEVSDKGTVLATYLLHCSGQYIVGYYPIEPIKKDPQGFGAAVTYARRYALQSIVGVCSEDDDGEGAMGRDADHRPPQGSKPKPPAPNAYRIPFGTDYKGKTLEEIPDVELSEMVSKLTKWIGEHKESKPEYVEFLKLANIKLLEEREINVRKTK